MTVTGTTLSSSTFFVYTREARSTLPDDEYDGEAADEEEVTVAAKRSALFLPPLWRDTLLGFMATLSAGTVGDPWDFFLISFLDLLALRAFLAPDELEEEDELSLRFLGGTTAGGRTGAAAVRVAAAAVPAAGSRK